MLKNFTPNSSIYLFIDGAAKGFSCLQQVGQPLEAH